MLLFHCRYINICREGIDLYRRESEAKFFLDEGEGFPELKAAWAMIKPVGFYKIWMESILRAENTGLFFFFLFFCLQFKI